MKWVVNLLLASAVASAGEASITERFTIAAPVAKVTDWIDSHAAEIRAAVNVQLVAKEGDVLTLRRQNNRGRWVWKQRETVKKSAGKYDYQTSLVACLEGGISRLDGVVTIESVDGETTITATSEASVEDVKDRDLEFDLRSRARRIRKLLQENLE